MMSPNVTQIDLDITFGTLPWKGWVAIVIVLGGFLCMILELTGPDFVMLGMLTIMSAFKIMPVSMALSGFSSTSLITITVLFVVAQGLINTGGVDWAISKILGSPKSTSVALVRMMVVTIFVSSWINNTPVVCIMIPIVMAWVSRSKLEVKQLLIPLSFSALLGGTNTIIGTSTNVIVMGQFNERILNPSSPYYIPGAKKIGLFSISPYGIPVAVWGAIYMLIAAPVLLPNGSGTQGLKACLQLLRRAVKETVPEQERERPEEFFIGLIVPEGSSLAGKTIEDAGLRHLDRLFLSNVRRDSETFHAVSPDFILQSGDVLFFIGQLDHVVSVAEKHSLIPYDSNTEVQTPFLTSTFNSPTILVPAPLAMSPTASMDSDLELGIKPEDTVTEPGLILNLVQATVRPDSDIVNQCIGSLDFRHRFGAAVVAVKRNGDNLHWNTVRIGQATLQAGDVLLLNVTHDFWTNEAGAAAFTGISRATTVKSANEFLIAMVVSGISGKLMLVGKSIKKAGLRQLPGAFLVAIQRGAETIDVVSPDETLRKNDILWFASGTEGIRYLRNMPGLRPMADCKTSKMRNTKTVDRRLVQVVVAPHSPLNGQSLKEFKFRDRFNAVVVAVSRQGQRIQTAPGDIVPRTGDVLLLDTGNDFENRAIVGPYFLLIQEVPNSAPPKLLHSFIALAATITAFALYIAGIFNISISCALAAMVMILTRCLSVDQARKSIRWDVVLVVGAALGVSTGMEASGASVAIANALVSAGRKAGGLPFIVASLYLATTLLSVLVNSSAAVSIVFPIGAAAAVTDSIDIYIIAYAVMLGATTVFASSFGYQTNLLVAGAGGYRNIDFIRFGGPMQIFMAVITITVLVLHSCWPVVWAFTGVVGAVILAAPEIMNLANLFCGKTKNSLK